MHGAMNQMVPQMPQGHFMGMNPMHSGSLPTSGAPPQVGGFPSGLQNMQGPSNTGGPPMYQQGGAFNRAPMMPGYNHFQVRQGILLLLFCAACNEINLLDFSIKKLSTFSALLVEFQAIFFNFFFWVC